jgi:hypothetical protein
MSKRSAKQGEGALRARGMLVMKTCGGSGGIAPSCLTSSLDGAESSASRRGKENPGFTCIGSRAGPRAGLDAVEKRKPLPLLGIEPLLFSS